MRSMRSGSAAWAWASSSRSGACFDAIHLRAVDMTRCPHASAATVRRSSTDGEPRKAALARGRARARRDDGLPARLGTEGRGQEEAGGGQWLAAARADDGTEQA